MAKPKGKVHIAWSPNFAYAIGLIVTDGCVSPDGRHVIFTSKDHELINHFQKCLGITCTVRKKSSGFVDEKKYFVIQFSDVLFCRFLTSIGIKPNKTKTIGSINVPDDYFFDFLRGHFDGDGHFYSYWDKRWPSSYMFYTCFSSASKRHVDWLRDGIEQYIGSRGHVTTSRSLYQLKYAKDDSLILLKNMYHSPQVPCLYRKHLKILQGLGIVQPVVEVARVPKSVDGHG